MNGANLARLVDHSVGEAKVSAFHCRQLKTCGMSAGTLDFARRGEPTGNVFI
jgi:hypothetical protein